MKLNNFIVKGGLYDLQDFYGQMSGKGTYIGLGRYEKDSFSERHLLVFETRQEKGFKQYKYSGAKIETSLNGEGDLFISLRNHYYGDSIKELRPVGYYYTEPKFELE